MVLCIPIWLFSLVITLALTGSNLLSVKNYGEFEFWLALCKVIAIPAFIFLGAVAISGFYPYAEVSGSQDCGIAAALCPTVSVRY